MAYLESQNYIHRWEHLFPRIRLSRFCQLKFISLQGPGCSQCPCWGQQHCEDCRLWAGSSDQGGRVRGEGGGEVPHQVDGPRGGQLQQVSSSMIVERNFVTTFNCQVLHQVGCMEFRHLAHWARHLWKNSISRWGACAVVAMPPQAIFL